MADHTYGISEIVGTSPDSIHQAIRTRRREGRAQTVRNLDWFEVHAQSAARSPMARSPTSRSR